MEWKDFRYPKMMPYDTAFEWRQRPTESHKHWNYTHTVVFYHGGGVQVAQTDAPMTKWGNVPKNWDFS